MWRASTPSRKDSMALSTSGPGSFFWVGCPSPPVDESVPTPEIPATPEMLAASSASDCLMDASDPPDRVVDVFGSWRLFELEGRRLTPDTGTKPGFGTGSMDTLLGAGLTARFWMGNSKDMPTAGTPTAGTPTAGIGGKVACCGGAASTGLINGPGGGPAVKEAREARSALTGIVGTGTCVCWHPALEGDTGCIIGPGMMEGVLSCSTPPSPSLLLSAMLVDRELLGCPLGRSGLSDLRKLLRLLSGERGRFPSGPTTGGVKDVLLGGCVPSTYVRSILEIILWSLSWIVSDSSWC